MTAQKQRSERWLKLSYRAKELEAKSDESSLSHEEGEEFLKIEDNMYELREDGVDFRYIDKLQSLGLG